MASPASITASPRTGCAQGRPSSDSSKSPSINPPFQILSHESRTPTWARLPTTQGSRTPTAAPPQPLLRAWHTASPAHQHPRPPRLSQSVNQSNTLTHASTYHSQVAVDSPWTPMQTGRTRELVLVSYPTPILVYSPT